MKYEKDINFGKYVLIISSAGAGVNVFDFVGFLYAMIFLDEIKSNILAKTIIPIICFNGVIFWLIEIVVGLKLKKLQVELKTKYRILLYGAVVYMGVSVFLYPLITKLRFIFGLMVRAQVLGGAIFFFQLSSCIGASVCILFCLISIGLEKKYEKEQEKKLR